MSYGQSTILDIDETRTFIRLMYEDMKKDLGIKDDETNILSTIKLKRVIANGIQGLNSIDIYTALLKILFIPVDIAEPVHGNEILEDTFFNVAYDQKCEYQVCKNYNPVRLYAHMYDLGGKNTNCENYAHVAGAITNFSGGVSADLQNIPNFDAYNQRLTWLCTTTCKNEAASSYIYNVMGTININDTTYNICIISVTLIPNLDGTVYLYEIYKDATNLYTAYRGCSNSVAITRKLYTHYSPLLTNADDVNKKVYVELLAKFLGDLMQVLEVATMVYEYDVKLYTHDNNLGKFCNLLGVDFIKGKKLYKSIKPVAPKTNYCQYGYDYADYLNTTIGSGLSRFM